MERVKEESAEYNDLEFTSKCNECNCATSGLTAAIISSSCPRAFELHIKLCNVTSNLWSIIFLRSPYSIFMSFMITSINFCSCSLSVSCASSGVAVMAVVAVVAVVVAASASAARLLLLLLPAAEEEESVLLISTCTSFNKSTTLVDVGGSFSFGCKRAIIILIIF